MNASEIDTKRQQVEAVYAEMVRELTEQRVRLDGWRDERLKALELISGDRWLDLPGIPDPVKPAAWTLTAPSIGQVVTGAPTMADVVRSAVFSIKHEFTKKTVEEWLKIHRPDMASDALSGAIRTTLWKMKKDGKIVEVRKDGVFSVYNLVDEHPTPSGVEDMLG